VIKVEISFRGLVLIILALAMLWVVVQLWPVLVLVLASVILMLGLLPYVESMARAGVSRTLAVVVIIVTILAVLGGLIGYMVPHLIDEIDAVRENLPESARQLEDFLADLGIEVELQDRVRNIEWSDLLSGQAAIDYGQRAVAIVFSIITVAVMTAYLLSDTPRIGRFLDQFIPEGRRDEAADLFWSMSSVVGGYLRGQFLTSAAIGTFTFIILTALDVDNPLAFAVLAAFADIIPLIGAFIAIVPPVAAALQQSTTTAIIVLALLVAYQQFEDRILVPRVYGRLLNLPPIIVLIAVLAGAELLGIIGVLLALPLTAAGRVIMDFTIERKRLPLVPDQPLAPDVETEGGEDSSKPEPEAATEKPPQPKPRLRRPRRAASGN
jgi:predicted PurR-regulated permease PerM